jgi:tetratricopeptide (TPR) repeat protein
MANDRGAPADASGELAAAIRAVENAPGDASRWERVEELTESEQQPDPVAAMFRRVLAGKLTPELASELGRRAVRFFETWYGEQSADLATSLERVLEIDPAAQWAFERLTVAYTVAERWKELLGAYDRAIARAEDTPRRARLLEEAAQAAKDFASDPDRAVGYMEALYALDPSNTQLGVSLERLLERQQRWDGLIALWESRLERQGAKQARDARVRIAECLAEKLRDHARALGQIREVLDGAPDHKEALALLERMVDDGAAGIAERRDAMEILKAHFTKKGKAKDVVRILELGLAFVAPEERAGLLRDLVQRLVDLGDEARATAHQARLLVLDPMPKEQDALRALTERTRDWTTYIDALIAAADACAQPITAVGLWMDAARTREEVLADEAGAIALYERVFAIEGTATRADAGRRLARLLEKTERRADTLAVLSKLSALEPEGLTRRTLLAQSARLATEVGDLARAEDAWRACIAIDPHDVEALDALVATSAARENWQALAQLLRQRCEAPGAADRRREDWAWLARVHADKLGQIEPAIEVWRKLLATYGEDRESVTALTDLLARAERWEELTEALRDAADHEVARFTELQTRLGDAYRERLGRAELAAQRYRAALQVDPANRPARDGLRPLMKDDPSRAIAIEALAQAYARTGEWKETLQLLEARLTLQEQPARRAELLVEAAKLHETKADDTINALACYRRAFALAADDRQTEREIRRLAEQLNAWDAVVGAYRETIARFERPTPRVAELWHDAGRTLEERLGDAAGALAAYEKAAAIGPDRVDHAESATRVAAQLGRWEEATRYALGCMIARSEFEERLLAVLEKYAESGNGWDALAEGASAALEVWGEEGPKALVRTLWSRVAQWELERCDDATRAEVALASAVDTDPTDVPTIERLITLRRPTPGAALVESLLRLADARPQDLAPLREAAEVAANHGDDAKQTRAILERLYETTAARFALGTADAETRECARWATDRLVERYSADGQPARARELLARSARFDLGAEHQRALRRQAARIARDLGDPVGAIELYRDLLQSDRTDRDALGALDALYKASDRIPELVALRRHELSLETDEERALALRLDIARLLGEIETRIGRLEALHENLRVRPGHPPTIEALGELLRQRGRHAELAGTLIEQARVLGPGDQARALVRTAASIWERDVRDHDRAIDVYQELHRLEPEGDASESLARLFGARGQHVEATRWLELRLQTAPPDMRALTAVDLARAHIEAGQRDKARRCLEEALGTDATLKDARALLADVYRRDGAWLSLAELLERGATHESDAPRRLAQLQEVARIHFEILAEPARAVGALRAAVALRPDDHGLAAKFAESLRAAGHHDEARKVLTGVLQTFGRKRSAERAEFHYQLARVEEAAGALDTAATELAEATKMDTSHVAALHALARLQRRRGELEPAERTLRGLLMLVRRHAPETGDATGPAEVFFDLSAVARARGDEGKAHELLESAMEAATQNEAEAKRFQRVLRVAGETDLLLRLLDARLELGQEPQQEAEILATKSEMVAARGDKDGALKLVLQALRLDPETEALHERTLVLARETGALGRYTDVLSTLADETTRKRGRRHRAIASSLTLRLAQVVEADIGDLDRAAGLYAKVEQLGEHVIESWLATARVSGARGDRDEQRRVLSRIAELPPEQASDEQRREARFALAELELARDDTRDTGVESLERALQGARDYARPKQILHAQLDRTPEHRGVLDLYEKVARASHDDSMLLGWFEARSRHADFDLDDVREGVSCARRLGATSKEEALLSRGVELVRALDTKERATGTWVLSALAECRGRAGDGAGAIRYLEEALAIADEREANALARQLAQLASGPGGDLAAAAKAYEKLLESDPTDRSLWEPLVEVYFRIGDRARFEDFVLRCLGRASTPSDRVALHLWHARFLADAVKDERAAATPLRGVLEEEPGQADATARLVDIYQRHAMKDELADLLTTQFDRARDRQDGEAVARIALELGELYGPRRNADAIQTYRTALEWAPEHAGLLRALLKRLGREAEARERAELEHALLKTTTGLDAEKLALSLADAWTKLDEPARSLEALEFGHRVHPVGTRLRDRLEAHYEKAQMWLPLSELLERDAARQKNRAEAVARLKRAAVLRRDQLGDLPAAAGALRKALEIAPDDLSLLAELARNLAAAGQREVAIQDVSRLLERRPEPDRVRMDLLRVRADLWLGLDRFTEAVTDLDEAYGIGGEEVAPKLVEALGQLKTRAFVEGDAAAERGATIRLVAVHDEIGNAAAARDVLTDWVQRDPNDVDALRGLRARDEAAENWDAVARTCERLIEIEQGASRAEAALVLAEACARAGRPEAARAGLERVHKQDPHDAQVRDCLRQLYEATGARAPLASILVADAEALKDSEPRIALLQRATQLYLEDGNAEAALTPLGIARKLRPDDPRTELLLIDIHVQLKRLDDAARMLAEAIAAKKGRRSPDLAVLQQRLSHVAAARGDVAEQMKWLNQAIETDRQSSQIAAELAEVAIQHANYDTAMKALRSITMMENPVPITRAMAFLKQAQIAFVRGDSRRAQHWARKAKSLDEGLAEADKFLAEIGPGV